LEILGVGSANPAHRRLRRPWLVIALGMAAASTMFGQVEEYRVKAFFLYNFARYVEWPAQAFHGPTDPIVICILGQNPFGTALEQAISGKLIGDRALAIRQVSGVQPGSSCHILYVSAAERKRFRSAAATLRGVGVLTVGEAPGFASEGGVINFKLEEGKVRFEINMDTAGQEGLRISSKLLSLAQIVKK
jgi:hypothetical protein